MGFFETEPQISATSTQFTLSNEIVSSDVLNLFVWALVTGLICGFIYAILRKVTSWIWN